jgi:tetratricopeptide (TPR) repeat protein
MPAMLIQLRHLFCLLLTAISITGIGLSQASRPAAPSSGKSKASDPSQEAITIEEVTTSVRFENDGSCRTITRQKTKIQNQAGVNNFGIISFNFRTGSELVLDTVEVHKIDGKVVKAGLENVQEVTPEISRVAPMYSDLRQKQVTVPGLAVGDEVYLQYTVKDRPLVPNQFWFQYSFSKSEVVLSETVELDVPSGRKVKLNSAPEYKPVVRTEADRTVYTWHSANAKPEGSEKEEAAQREQLATGTLPAPSLELSTFESWDAVGSWYFALQNERAIPTAAVKAKALEIIKDKATAEDKIKALYQYVSLNFRYIGLDFGIGRYQPHSADMVLSNGYGDCKDKHTLLAAMLESVGLKAYPALINSSHELDMAVPSPAQFDHLITAVSVGSNTVFLDTTQEVAPFAMLVLPLRNKPALVMKGPAAAQFIKTSQDLPFQAFELFEFNGKVDDSGTMNADVTYFLRGDAEVSLKNALRKAPPNKYKDVVQYMSYYVGFGGDVSDVELTGLQDIENGLKIRYHYQRKSYLDFNDNPPKNTLPLASARLQEFSAKEDVLRLHASPTVLTYKCRVEFPAGVTAQIPLPVSLHRDYLQYESSYTIDKNVLTGMRKLSVSDPVLRAAHRQDYEAFRRALQSDEGQQMVLRMPAGFEAKAAPVSKDEVDELAHQAEIEYREKAYSDALRDYRKVAALDPKRKGVWTQVGLAESNMRTFDQAVVDFKKGIEADPYDAQAHAELGAVYITTRKLDLAATELKKAMDIDPLQHRAHYLLGWLYSEQKKDYASAAPELEKALATESEGFNDQSQINELLATAYLKTQQTEKAIAKLKDVTAAAPNPVTWNNAAYTLAENNADLELAHQYADSALHGIYERLNKVQLDAVGRKDAGVMNLLAMTWDTMGWIHFKNGNFPLAEKYVRAAWELGQSREVSLHLGEIYQKLGHPQQAMQFYSFAARSTFVRAKDETPDPGRDRLVKLAGPVRAGEMIRSNIGLPSKMRTVHLGNIASSGYKGEFFFVFAPGPKLLSVQTIEGDSSLEPALSKIGDKLAASAIFPEGAPGKLIRQGIVNCSPYTKGCDLVFYTSDVPDNVNGLGAGEFR